MPTIQIENLHNLKITSTEDNSKALLHIILAQGYDWMHACGGKGKCTTCKVIILSGGQHLGSTSEAEEKFRLLGRLKDGERLSCQCMVTGDISIKVPEGSKLPHITYSE